MLYGADVVKANVLGLQAGRTTRGHRFHYNNAIELAQAGDYLAALKNTNFCISGYERAQNLN